MNSKKLKTDVMDHEAGKEYVCAENTKMVSGQRLEWTIINKLKVQFFRKHRKFEGSVFQQTSKI